MLTGLFDSHSLICTVEFSRDYMMCDVIALTANDKCKTSFSLNFWRLLRSVVL